AGRPIATVIDPRKELFPFAADFAPTYFVGKLPDGTQFFAFDPGSFCYDPSQPPDELVTVAQLFDPEGTPTEQREIRLPVPLLNRSDKPGTSFAVSVRRDEAMRKRRHRYLRELIGFEPAFIQVKAFDLEGVGPYRGESGTGPGDPRGYPDNPNTAPE